MPGPGVTATSSAAERNNGRLLMSGMCAGSRELRSSCHNMLRYARSALFSRRLVRRNLPDLWRKHVFGGFEIEARLTVHPERGAGLEELAEPQCGIGRNGLF